MSSEAGSKRVSKAETSRVTDRAHFRALLDVRENKNNTRRRIEVRMEKVLRFRASSSKVLNFDTQSSFRVSLLQLLYGYPSPWKCIRKHIE